MALSIDLLLGLTLLWLAWRVLSTADLYESVVLFVTFGLLMALAWMRLDAPDVAMAEAAIGAGLSGALLMSAIARLSPAHGIAAGAAEEGAQPPLARAYRLALACLLLLTVAGLGVAVAQLPPGPHGLGPQVQAALPDSGVTHGVTAVLLNFRGYDTLLELVVLLMVAVAVRAMAPMSLRTAGAEVSPVLQQLAQWLVPVLILVAAYLLWTGSSSPGGAFQAGATLGGAGVLFMLSFPYRLRPLHSAALAWLLCAGVLAFVALAVLGLVVSGALLAYPPPLAGALILLVETVATVSIAVTLMALFAGPSRRAAQEAVE